MPLIEIHVAGNPYRARTRHILIGRNSKSDIRLSDDIVSSRHAELTARGDQWILTDLGSTNGTFVAGRRIDRPTVLGIGVAVQIGEGGPLLLIARSEADAPPPAARPRKTANRTPPPLPGPVPSPSRTVTPMRLAIVALSMALLASIWIERAAVGELLSEMLARARTMRTAGSGDDPATREPTLTKRDRVASAEELRRDALAPAAAPLRWTTFSIDAFLTDPAHLSTAASEFLGDPLQTHSPLIRQGDHTFVGGRLKATERPLLVEWHEGGITVEDIEDIVAVGNDPAACVLLLTENDRVAVRGTVFKCIVRHPHSYPDAVGNAPRPPERAQGRGRLELRRRPSTEATTQGIVVFTAADLSEEPDEVAAIVWDDIVQSMKTVDIEGTPIPLFVSFGDRPGHVAGWVTLKRALKTPSCQWSGLRLHVPELPTEGSLPALGGEDWFFVIGDRP